MKLSTLLTLSILTVTAIGFTRLSFAGPDDDGLEDRDVNADVQRIQKLLAPSGLEIAGTYVSQVDAQTGVAEITKIQTGDNQEETLNGHYVFADLNGDGKEDLVLAAEEAPTKDADGTSHFGARHLQVYLADVNGNLNLVSDNSKVLLKADANGTSTDPFDGIQLGIHGGFEISHSGILGEVHWTRIMKFKFRDGDFYQVAQTDLNEKPNDQTSTIVDVSLVDGKRVTTEVKADGSSSDATDKVAVQALQKFSDSVFVQPN